MTTGNGQHADVMRYIQNGGTLIGLRGADRRQIAYRAIYKNGLTLKVTGVLSH